MNLLILGGTIFLGRHLAAIAAARGHAVTLFNRGRTNPDLFPDLEHLRGDRSGDLAPLDGRRWDAAIDTSGYRPADVRRSAARLAGAVDRYVFISTISVYADFRTIGLTEAAPLAPLPAGADPNRVTPDTYGPLKALAEAAVEAAFPRRSIRIRPGLIVGPHDPTGRFPYWPHRIAAGGDVLAPGTPDRPLQILDVRDLAGWILELIEAGTTGVFNAAGPAEALTFGDLLAACRAVAGSTARCTWVEDAFLLERGVTPWIDLPLWIPASRAESAGFYRVNTDRARSAGLRPRPLAETIRDTLAWIDATPDPPIAGLDRGREAALLAAWRNRG